MTLAALIEESRKDREAWRYTPLAACAKKAGVAGTAGAEAKATATATAVRGPALASASSSPSSAATVFPAGAGGVLRFRDARLSPSTKEDAAREALAEKDGLYRLTLAPGRSEMQFGFSGQGAEAAPKLQVELEAGTEATLVLRFLGGGVAMPELSFLLREGARLTLFGAVEGRGLHLARYAARLEKNARLAAFSVLTGGPLVREEWRVELAGEGAGAGIKGLMKAAGKDQVEAHCACAHAARETRSEQLFKTLLDDAARGVFLGKIAVLPGAQKADGAQTSRALLLSKRAEMIQRPALEIEADDVKAAHGGAVGDLDADEMFYLRARGLPEEEARRLLIGAFWADALAAIDDAPFAALARKLLGVEEAA